MSEYPTNSTAKVYYDCEGNERTLYQMVRTEPEWAMSRIQVGEAAIKELEHLKAAQAQAGDGEAPVAWLNPAHELVENSAPDVVTAELRGATIARGGIAASCMENYSVPLYKKQPAVNQQLLDALRLAETSMLDSGYSPQSVTIITVKAAIAAAQEQGK
jgi:hypothetical protein